MSNDEYRLTQNGIVLSDNGCYVYQPYVGTMAMAEWSWTTITTLRISRQ